MPRCQNAKNAEMSQCQNADMKDGPTNLRKIPSKMDSANFLFLWNFKENKHFVKWITSSPKMSNNDHEQRKIAITRRSWHLQSSNFPPQNSNYMLKNILIVPRLPKRQKHVFEDISRCSHNEVYDIGTDILLLTKK